MSTYIKLSTLEYPRHEGDIRLEHPDIREDQTWPNFPCPDTYALVVQTDPPTIDATEQYCYQGAPVQVDGVWRSTWEVETMTAEQKSLRAAWLEQVMKDHFK
jgi:hypothetical protein